MTGVPKKSSIAIVGGGIQGLMLAFCLAERGQRGIVVVDAGYWQGGASGRNGTMVRAGFSSPEWTGLFSYSHRLWLGLSKRLGHNVMFTRRGYVVIAESDRTAAIGEESLATHRALDVASRPLMMDEFERLVPLFHRSLVKHAYIFDDGGMAPHHAVMKGLRAACLEHGIDLRYQTKVTGIERAGDRVTGLRIGDTRIDADTVVIAAGGHSSEVAAMAGVELEGRAWRLEACATEPLRPILGPALVLLDRSVYVHQTGRGEIVGGCEVAGDMLGATLRSDMPVLAAYARHLVETMPVLASLRVLRQWAGLLHASADFGPLLGPHPDCRNLWISAGWSYGIMGAPAAGDLLAKAILTGEIDPRMAPFTVDRKRRGKLIAEGAIVVSD
ncbi:MAG: FAD-binding oxidoreductase [Rhodospirillaceae bacterium]|nr:FAD-binding oxidoreductase [Rhodospirillaceae bacterium]